MANEPTSIMDFVNSVIDDLGVIDESHPDHDRVDIGWWEAMEAIKGLIEDRVPVDDSVKDMPEQIEHLSWENKLMARYIAKRDGVTEKDIMSHIEQEVK